MTFLLDANVVSEPGKPRPAGPVLLWLSSTPPTEMYLSVMTLGEIHKGADMVRGRSPRRAAALDAWLASTRADFAERIVPVDGLLAATALVHSLTVVTRNVGHVERTGVTTLNPFDA